MFEIVHHLLTVHALFSAMKERQRVLYLKLELSWLLPFVGYSYIKQNKTCLLGDVELLFSCSTRYFTISSRRIEEKFHVSECPCVTQYFIFIKRCNHNYIKILESDWSSAGLISAVIVQLHTSCACNWTVVHVMPE